MRNVAGICLALLTLLTGIGGVSIADAALDIFKPDEVGAVQDYREEVELFEVVRTHLGTPIDFHVKGIRLGSTERDVRKAFGKPSRVVTPHEGHADLRILEYDGLEIRIGEYENSKTVDSIEITNSKYGFQGVTIGSTLEQLHKELGREHYSNYDGLLGYHAITQNGYIAIIHDGTIIIRITNAYDGC